MVPPFLPRKHGQSQRVRRLDQSGLGKAQVQELIYSNNMGCHKSSVARCKSNDGNVGHCKRRRSVKEWLDAAIGVMAAWWKEVAHVATDGGIGEAGQWLRVEKCKG